MACYNKIRLNKRAILTINVEKKCNILLKLFIF